MNTRTQRILLTAGYKIYRLDLIRNQIRYCKSPGGWGICGTFETQTATKRAFDELLKNERNLED